MKQTLSFLGLLLLQLSLGISITKAQSAAAIQQKLASVFESQQPKPLSCAHRGDWRNTPENSVQALQNCIKMGVDIMELDLKRSKDGQLIVMHDNTIDRTVKAKGKPEDYTLAQLKKFWLRNGTGHATTHKIPTFEEMMLVAKDKIIIDIDKGYEYFDEVIAILQKTGTLHQVVLNVTKNLPFDSVKTAHKNIPEGLILMPVIDAKDKNAAAVLNSYKSHKKTIFQFDFDDDSLPLLNSIPELKQQHFGIWMNSLWPELCGGHDDDRAVEKNQAAESWGWLVAKKTNIIQTDRPAELIRFLKSKTN